MSFAVFLDIDGVLNTKSTCETTPDMRVGIDDLRVAVLAGALRKYGGGEIILTSDWKMNRPESGDYKYLVEKLAKYRLQIADKTTDKGFQRGEGILRYVKEHPEIDEYVILDDNLFDFQDYPALWERLIRTNGIERAEFASETPRTEALIFKDYIDEVS